MVEAIVGCIYMLLRAAIRQTVAHAPSFVHQVLLNLGIIAIDLPVTIVSSQGLKERSKPYC